MKGTVHFTAKLVPLGNDEILIVILRPKISEVFITDWFFVLIIALQIIPPPITKTDFDKVLARQRPTVSKADLDVHERFTQEFGEEG